MNTTNVRLLRGEYVGTDIELYGKTALLLVRGPLGATMSQDDRVKAQFDELTTKNNLGFGWHEFPASQWEIDWDHDRPI